MPFLTQKPMMIDDNDMVYTGYRTVLFDEGTVGQIFQHPVPDPYGCTINEYVIMNDQNDNLVALCRCNADRELEIVPFKMIDSQYMGKIKPRNIQQRMAIDMLYRDEQTVKVLTGRYGTGKDFLMCGVAMDMLERGVVDRIVVVRNNIEVRGSKPIGFLPGSPRDKMLPWAGPLMDHMGGEEGLNRLMDAGKLEIAHLGFIRGRDIRHSIIFCSEAENLLVQHVQLLLGRVSEGSSLWLNGDYKQADEDIFLSNSGLMTAVTKLSGHPRFGYVQLQKTERSETAAMADLLD